VKVPCIRNGCLEFKFTSASHDLTCRHAVHQAMVCAQLRATLRMLGNSRAVRMYRCIHILWVVCSFANGAAITPAALPTSPRVVQVGINLRGGSSPVLGRLTFRRPAPGLTDCAAPCGSSSSAFLPQDRRSEFMIGLSDSLLAFADVPTSPALARRCPPRLIELFMGNGRVNCHVVHICLWLGLPHVAAAALFSA